MSVTIVCDADRKTILEPKDVRTVGFGVPRHYSPEAAEDVEAYLKTVLEGAAEARKLYAERRDAAAAVFRAKYPEGLLPDDGVPNG